MDSTDDRCGGTGRHRRIAEPAVGAFRPIATGLAVSLPPAPPPYRPEPRVPLQRSAQAVGRSSAPMPPAGWWAADPLDAPTRGEHRAAASPRPLPPGPVRRHREPGLHESFSAASIGAGALGTGSIEGRPTAPEPITTPIPRIPPARHAGTTTKTGTGTRAPERPADVPVASVAAPVPDDDPTEEIPVWLPGDHHARPDSRPVAEPPSLRARSALGSATVVGSGRSGVSLLEDSWPGRHPQWDTAPGLSKFNIGLVPAPITPPASWRRAAWFSVVSAGLVLASLVTVTSVAQQTREVDHSDTLPDYPNVVQTGTDGAHHNVERTRRSGDENDAPGDTPLSGADSAPGDSTTPTGEGPNGVRLTTTPRPGNDGSGRPVATTHDGQSSAPSATGSSASRSTTPTQTTPTRTTHSSSKPHPTSSSRPTETSAPSSTSAPRRP